MAEGARLESVYTATYRGFESPPHRQIRVEFYSNCGRRVGYAHYPAADKEFFASGNAHRLSHRSLIRCAFGAA